MVRSSCPPDATSHKDLEELEKKSFDGAKGRSGQPAATISFGKPLKGDEKPITETFKVDEVVARPTGQPYRVGFDALQPAVGYASMVGLGTGAVVVKEDQFYFVAKVAPGALEANSVLRFSRVGADAGLRHQRRRCHEACSECSRFGRTGR
jgi:hypothetical protein